MQMRWYDWAMLIINILMLVIALVVLVRDLNGTNIDHIKSDPERAICTYLPSAPTTAMPAPSTSSDGLSIANAQ